MSKDQKPSTEEEFLAAIQSAGGTVEHFEGYSIWSMSEGEPDPKYGEKLTAFLLAQIGHSKPIG